MGVNLVNMNTRIGKISNIWHSLTSGQPIDEDALSLPYRCTMLLDEELADASVSKEDDNEQEPEQPLFYSFYPSACVMKNEMVETLLGAGVDNLQVFPAIVDCNATNTTFNDYSVVNIIGLVACAALNRSQSSSLADLRFFHRLALDERKTGGLRLFRLAESQLDIIADESIAMKLRDGAFIGLELEELETAR